MTTINEPSEALYTSGPAPVRIPLWTLADRLRKTMRDAGMNSADMAEQLDISVTTVQNWAKGATTPGGPELRAWAMLTGVSYEWLREGIVPEELREQYGTGLIAARTRFVRRQGLEPRTR